jgi:hypothetical protein
MAAYCCPVAPIVLLPMLLRSDNHVVRMDTASPQGAQAHPLHESIQHTIGAPLHTLLARPAIFRCTSTNSLWATGIELPTHVRRHVTQAMQCLLQQLLCQSLHPAAHKLTKSGAVQTSHKPPVPTSHYTRHASTDAICLPGKQALTNCPIPDYDASTAYM